LGKRLSDLSEHLSLQKLIHKGWGSTKNVAAQIALMVQLVKTCFFLGITCGKCIYQDNVIGWSVQLCGVYLPPRRKGHVLWPLSDEFSIVLTKLICQI